MTDSPSRIGELLLPARRRFLRDAGLGFGGRAVGRPQGPRDARRHARDLGGRVRPHERLAGGKGRDHNPGGFKIWMAGGGVRPGLHYGATDPFGYKAVEKKVHVNDLHATLLYLLGIDHEQLTYRHNGRNFRLTDVGGHVIDDLMA